MTTPVNPHSKWYHCLCCLPTNSVDSGSKSVAKEIEASPAGHWENGKFQEGPKVTEAFRKEFEGK